ncbi:unnamed protein product [Rotaria socialis]|uniref:Uncharacterized protein n=1 Tax=Rotaria socialis TaxID=392032 RepID=A0A817RCX6_9BILA|nr:unnamed protein product [Rotaria socialis]CAF3455763.1 unnamed protein product [Rotaria socialis]CAF3474819.1 unnamed protein product [Rotaria socialis]CAF3714145.1 unnamed protein product [Rotaria socialis]CAF4422319.1 unnamed protein product [Rotaria socialis]
MKYLSAVIDSSKSDYDNRLMASNALRNVLDVIRQEMHLLSDRLKCIERSRAPLTITNVNSEPKSIYPTSLECSTTNMFESYPAEIEIDRHTVEFTPARSQVNNNRLILNESQSLQLMSSHILATQPPMRYQRTSALQPIQRPMSDSPIHVKEIFNF